MVTYVHKDLASVAAEFEAKAIELRTLAQSTLLKRQKSNAAYLAREASAWEAAAHYLRNTELTQLKPEPRRAEIEQVSPAMESAIKLMVVEMATMAHTRESALKAVAAKTGFTAGEIDRARCRSAASNCSKPESSAAKLQAQP